MSGPLLSYMLNLFLEKRVWDELRMSSNWPSSYLLLSKVEIIFWKLNQANLLCIRWTLSDKKIQACFKTFMMKLCHWKLWVRRVIARAEDWLMRTREWYQAWSIWRLHCVLHENQAKWTERSLAHCLAYLKQCYMLGWKSKREGISKDVKIIMAILPES